MSTTRQLKYAGLIKKDLSEIFQRDVRHIIGKSFVTITGVEVSPDLGYAKIYISLMLVDDKPAFISMLEKHKKEFRKSLGNKIGKQVRIVPEISFFLDETQENARKMDEIIAVLVIPPAEDKD